MPINLQYALWGIVAVLVLGTLAILLKTQIAASADDRELWLRMQSWWIMAGLFVLAIVLIVCWNAACYLQQNLTMRYCSRLRALNHKPVE